MDERRSAAPRWFGRWSCAGGTHRTSRRAQGAKPRPVIVLSTAFSVIGVTVASAQSPWCEYERTTIASLVEQGRAAAAGTAEMMSGDQFPSRVAVEYSGKSRMIPDDRDEFLRQYLVVFLGRPDAAQVCKRELLFQEPSHEYWLPIQETMADQFANELSDGDTLTLFLLFAGMRSIDRAHDAMMLIADFTSPTTADYWEGELATCNE